MRTPLTESTIQDYLQQIEPLKGGFDLIKDHVVVTDENANILYANKAVEEHTGFSVEEAVGKNPADLWGGKMPKEFYEKMWNTIKFKKTPFVGEIKNIRKDGSEYWQEVHISPILNEEGNVKFFIGIEPDISSKKNLERINEAQLSLSAYIIKEIMTEAYDIHSAIAIVLKRLCTFGEWDLAEAWIPDADEKYLIFDGAWYREPHLEKFVDSSQHIRFLRDEGLPGRVWQHQEHEWVQNVSLEPKEKFLRADIARTAGLKSALGMPILSGDKVLVVIVIFIFEERKKDEESIKIALQISRQLGIFIRQKIIENIFKKSWQKAEAEKDDFISLISHQLKNPLTSAKWAVEGMLKKNTLTPDEQAVLKGIHNKQQELITLVRDLSIISRVGDAKTEKETIDLSKMIADILEDAKKQHPAISFSFREEAKEILLMANKTLAEQLFSNIIFNAAEYSDKNRGMVEAALSKENNGYIFSCKDNGIGIPKKYQEKIFSKFFRAPNAEEIREGGTGLGVFIAKMICDRFGWKIWFQSPPANRKEGTVFFIQIPVAKILS